jgi:hypothetical protein
MSEGIIYESNGQGGYEPTYGDLGDIKPRPSPYSPPQCFQKPRTPVTKPPKRKAARHDE